MLQASNITTTKELATTIYSKYKIATMATLSRDVDIIQKKTMSQWSLGLPRGDQRLECYEK